MRIKHRLPSVKPKSEADNELLTLFANEFVVFYHALIDKFTPSGVGRQKEDRTFSAYVPGKKLNSSANASQTRPQSILSYNSLSGKVLVLNQSYEPISVCSVRKAVMLVFLSKAELVESRNGTMIHTIRQHFPYPSVIRLQSFIRVPYKKVELSRKNIMRRDSFRCQYCGSQSHPLTLDHVIPRSRGGVDSWENLVAACIPCNNRKGNRTPEEAGLRLLNSPRKPNHIVFLKHFMGKVDEPWRPYLFFD